jgi:opacity protein-like surface antigen
MITVQEGRDRLDRRDGRSGAVQTFRSALTLVALGLCATAQPAAAQSLDEPPALALRPFVVVTRQWFAATETFDAAFGRAVEPLYGGGLQLVSGTGVYLDIAASRFKKTGERAFRFNDETFRLGLPLTVTITPIEVAAGYRFGHARRVVPYAGVGIGWYRYQETSEFADEDIDTRETGYLAHAGVDVRAARWIRVGVDAQYTRVKGILGQGGFSQVVGEDDLGGIAARLRLTVGR